MVNYFGHKKKIKKEKTTPEYELKKLKENITADFYAQWPYWWKFETVTYWTKYTKWKWRITVTNVWHTHCIWFDDKSVLSLSWDEIKNFVQQIDLAIELNDLNKRYNPQRTPTTKEVFEDLEEIEKKKKEIEEIRWKYKSDFDKTFKK